MKSLQVGDQQIDDEDKLTKELNGAFARSGCCSMLTFHWATRLICRSFREQLKPEHVWDFPKRLKAKTAAERVFAAYERECDAHPNLEDRSLKRALFKEFWCEMLRPVAWKCLWIATVSVTATVCLRGLLQELSNGPTYREVAGNSVPLDAILYTCGFFFTESMRSLCHANFWFAGVNLGVKLRSGVRMLLMKHILKLSTAHASSGNVINFVTNFSERLFYASRFGVFLFSCPATLIVTIGLAIWVIGWAALAGFAVLLVLAPLQFVLGKRIGELRRKAIKVTDERIGLMDEILTSIKLIKLYAWEWAFANKTSEVRSRERKVLMAAAFTKVFNRAIADSGPALITATMFGTHLAMTGQPLSVSQTYTAITLFNMCRFPLTVMPLAVRFVAESMVGLNRVNHFLNNSATMRDVDAETLVCEATPSTVAAKSSDRLDTFAIDIRGACCKWQHDDSNSRNKQKVDQNHMSDSAAVGLEMTSSATGSKEETISDEHTNKTREDSASQVEAGSLCNINLQVRPGTLLAVVGEVGSGKTSILEGLILGHMELTAGSVKLNTRSMAYCAQSPWIFTATLRENITFECLERASNKMDTLGSKQQPSKGTEQTTNKGAASKSIVSEESNDGQGQKVSLYEDAVRSCCLQPDLDTLPAGDETEIGERGINLSGGQKARVALARAVYAQPDIVLLDDPLSAVDAQVARHLFDECIGPQGSLVKNVPHCTRILVTHQVQFLSQCDLVCIVKNSTIKSMGTFTELLNRGEFDKETIERQVLSQNENIDDSAEGKVDLELSVQDSSPTLSSKTNRDIGDKTKSIPPGTLLNKKEAKLQTGKLTTAEHRAKGAVGCAIMNKYFVAMGSGCCGVLYICSFFLPQLVRLASDLWLILWLDDGINTGQGLNLWQDNETGLGATGISRNDSGLEPFPQTHYFAVYVSLAIFLAMAFAGQMSFLNCLMLRAGSALHDRVFGVVLRGTMTYFDTNPTGRILNKFGSDMDQIDVQLDNHSYVFVIILLLLVYSQLPDSLESLFTLAFFVLTTLVIIAVVLPWFLLALLIVLVGYMGLTLVFRKAVRQFKRMDSIAKSPLYTHVQNTVSGLATISAFGRQNDYLNTFALLADNSSRALFGFHAVGRWFGYRLDFLTTFIITSSALITILSPGIPAASAGMVITYALTTGGSTQYLTRLISEAEAYLTSVERLLEFEELTPQEKSVNIDASKRMLTDINPNENKEHAPKSEMARATADVQKNSKLQGGQTSQIANWPPSKNAGLVEFKNFSARYRKGLPLVLKNISFTIQSGESIGIVGRTGSGKSSLTMALYRIIGGVSGQILIDGLDIGAIPLHQLRSNLAIIPQDPVLFQGTVRYNLDPFNKYEDHRLWAALENVQMAPFVRSLPEGMSSRVDSGGSNFSQGQRQLFCFARALLRENTSLIIMDEATASVDNKTDSIIQKTIQSSFKSITLLVIAHRLSTVMTCDKILALAGGEVSEFGSPKSLLEKSSGETSRLVAETGPKNEAYLRSLVYGRVSTTAGKNDNSKLNQ